MMVTRHEARQAMLAFIEVEQAGKFDISLDLRDGEIYFGLKIMRGAECSAERARYWLDNYLYWSPGAGYRMERKDGSVQLERIGVKPRQPYDGRGRGRAARES